MYNRSMKRTRVFFHGAFAAMIAFGICGGGQLKAQDAAGSVYVVRVGQVDVIPEDGFDAGAGLYQGIVAAGVNPPVVGPPPTWPCFGGGGDAPCSSLPAGGFVVPFPLQVIGVNTSGEIVSTFSTTTATGTATLTIKVTQGSKTIFSNTVSFSVSANGIWYAYVENVKLSGAAKGTATVTVTTTVGATTITGKTALHIQ